MNTALAAQQSALLHALWSPDLDALADDPLRPAPLRGLRAYRTNARALAERAISAAYPVLGQLIGADNLRPLAIQCWQQHPPLQGDLACWGAVLPDFIAASAQLAELPYLRDVARVEWALHHAASAADAALNPGSFALLSQSAPEHLTLRLAPGTALIASPWPVVSLVQAHQSPEPELEAVAARLHAQVGETALVWRQGLQPQVSACDPAPAALLAALLAGQSLHHALPAALAADPAFDLGGWLHSAVMQGLVLGVQALADTAPTTTGDTP